MKPETNFTFSEEHYRQFLTYIQVETKIELTELEAGTCRAALDLSLKGERVMVPKSIEKQLERFKKAKLVNADHLKYAGAVVPMGVFKKAIERYSKPNPDDLPDSIFQSPKAQ